MSIHKPNLDRQIDAAKEKLATTLRPMSARHHLEQAQEAGNELEALLAKRKEGERGDFIGLHEGLLLHAVTLAERKFLSKAG